MHSLKISLAFLFISSFTYAQFLTEQDFKQLHLRNIGPAGMSGRVTSIDVVEADPSIIYIGAASGGVWKTTNAGDTWKPIFKHEKVASVGAIAIDQRHPDVIWVGTGEGNPRNSANGGFGIYKSLDGGRTWKSMGLEKTRVIHRIIINPDNPDHVVVAAQGSQWGSGVDRGIYITIDGGVHWRKTLFINKRTGASDLVVDPSNPNKLFAGMWEFRRWPWFFKSGGEGSGLYRSIDGGLTWTKITHDDGLPEGELGRIGLAIANSHPNRVYAYIESKNNAIFRSDDGGYHWKQVSKNKDKNIGGRPFYYADLYVDTENEDRVYSIATEVTYSEDAGRTWQVYVPGNRVHTDHHAWWSHPQDHNFIILGHDGGLTITHDRGKHWRFIDNLPLGQFYHVRVDNDLPYHVYGGLQDNGSWRGPSEVWFKGGIRNMYWQRLSVGDGFDMVPDPLDNRFGWSMGQAGTLYRYDVVSGQLLMSKPVHPEGIPLRYNWNAGIAVDPFDKKSVYYGSQFLMKSNDYGKSWTPISPDLTTNDPAKQKQLESGGLTYDATGAENYTTIIAIAPSPVKKGIIWVGTDDGNVQLTKDGGGSWLKVSDNIKGVPRGTWVPHIVASTYAAGEAFVVFDDHRRDNWTPYVFKTSDYGNSWIRIVDDADVWGFTQSFVQDPVAPNLYFTGAEDGLYFSLDAGNHWQKWKGNFPTVPVSDLAIHPRTGDLIIATFGRAFFWILDDLQPLREMSLEGNTHVGSRTIHIFKPSTAYLVNRGESFGYRKGKVGDALFEGENRAEGAIITYSLNYALESGPKKINKNPLEDSVRILIRSGLGDTIRTMFKTPRKGITRFTWKLNKDKLRFPGQKKALENKPPKGGDPVMPGEYTVHVTYMENTDSATIHVLPDPRITISKEEMKTKEVAIESFEKQVKQVTLSLDLLQDVRNKLKYLEKKLDKGDSAQYLLIKKGKAMINSIGSLISVVLPPDSIQGIYRDPSLLVSKLRTVRFYLGSPLVALTPNQQLEIDDLNESINSYLEKYNAFIANSFSPYENELKNHFSYFAKDPSLFKIK